MLENIFIGALLVVFCIVKSQKKVQAHGVWFTRRCDAWQLALGEGYKDNAYTPQMVTNISGCDAEYNAVAVCAVSHENYITIDPPPNLSVGIVSFDYGIWSNQPDGTWVNLPLNEVPGATIGTHALKYSVNYFAPVKKVQPIPELPLQIVPLTDPSAIKIGDFLTIQVLYKGKPMPHADLIPDLVNQHTVTVKTDDAGKAVVRVSHGTTNVIAIEVACNYDKKTSQATRDKICATLSFTIYPEESLH